MWEYPGKVRDYLASILTGASIRQQHANAIPKCSCWKFPQLHVSRVVKQKSNCWSQVYRPNLKSLANHSWHGTTRRSVMGVIGPLSPRECTGGLDHQRYRNAVGRANTFVQLNVRYPRDLRNSSQTRQSRGMDGPWTSTFNRLAPSPSEP